MTLQLCNDVLEGVGAETTLCLNAKLFVALLIALLQITHEHLHASEHEEEEGQEKELRSDVKEDEDKAKDDVGAVRLQEGVTFRIGLALEGILVLLHEDRAPRAQNKQHETVNGHAEQMVRKRSPESKLVTKEELIEHEYEVSENNQKEPAL